MFLPKAFITSNEINSIAFPQRHNSCAAVKLVSFSY